jgi:hypothetical protein
VQGDHEIGRAGAEAGDVASDLLAGGRLVDDVR